MKKKIFGVAVAIAITPIAALNLNLNVGTNELSALTMENIVALADGESACPNGCRSAGWGFQEVMKCDCTYTSYFSSCDSWGC